MNRPTSKALTIHGEQSRTIDPVAYAQLLKAIRAEIAAGKRLIQRAEALTNWGVGRHISKFILQGKGRAGYGKRVFEHLQDDLQIHKVTLHQAVKFYEMYPKGIVYTCKQLEWSHHRALLALPDPSARRELIQKVIREKLNARQLQKEVARYKTDHKAPAADQPIPKLTVERGKLYTYRSVQAKKPSGQACLPAGRGKAKKVRIDCGFNVWRTIALVTPQKVSPDTLYTSIKTDDDSYRLQPAQSDPKELFTYKAELERVVDADTPWVVIDCGFETEVRQKLRLRGINAPELNTRLGRKAKRFVEKLLKPCPFIIVKTYKDRSDKYDRYLADIFYSPTELDPALVAATGEYLNQRLLDAGLAQVYKE